MIKEIKILSQLEELTGEGSQKLKQELIKSSINPRLSYVLDICFNPFVTTKLHKLKFQDQPTDSEFRESKDDFLWDEFKDLVEDLKKAPAANDTLRSRAQNLISYRLSDSDEEDSKIRKNLMKILTKRMNIGIGAKLINKALGKELIPDPSLMLATDDHETIEKWDQIYCEEKYDGVRVIAIYKNGEITYFTRAFNELDASCFPKITFDLKLCMINSGLVGNWFFDGELTDLNRKSVSGKVTQILKGTVDERIESGMLFNVFDLEELVTLDKGKGVINYETRRDTLEVVLSDISEDSPIKLAKMWKVNDASEVTEIYKRIVADGGEGVICKDNGVYQCSRSKSWVKFKEINDCDLEITGWYPGEGKREGYIGGFICSSSCGNLNVNVGSGFTDDFIRSTKGIEDSFIGKIIKVEYNVRISDKNGNESLFLPRMKEIRPDKFTANNIDEIR